MSLQNVNSYTYSPGFTQGQYHNAVLCISGNVQTLYLNGVLVGTTTTASNILSYYPTINQILVGCAGDKSNGFTGYLDDFRVYKYAFNPSQVSSLYSNRNIIAHYTFDTSFNNVANNIITTANNATVSYDATMIGNASINNTTSNYKMGTGALNLTNTAGAKSTSYVNSTCGFSTTATNQLSISLWFKTTAVSGRKMRLIDLSPAAGTPGIFVDISGTTGIKTLFNYVEVLIPAFIPQIIDTLSTTAYNNIVYSGTGTVLQAGAFGIRLLLYSARTNPVIQIKAGAGGTPTDFYASTDGTANITTGPEGTGTGIVAFLNGAVGYVTKWYDQTGNGHHATAQGATLPFLDTTNSVVDFGSSGYFTLADSSYPTGNTPYTYFFKQGRKVNSNTTVWSGGTWGNYGQMGILIASDDYDDTWYAYDFWGISVVENALVAVTYGGQGNNKGNGGKKFYINNVLQISPMTDSYGPRTQTAESCYFGASHPSGRVTYGTYKSTTPYFYWIPYQLSTADIAILGST